MINVAGSRLVEQSLDSSDTFIDLLLDRFFNRTSFFVQRLFSIYTYIPDLYIFNPYVKLESS